MDPTSSHKYGHPRDDRPQDLPNNPSRRTIERPRNDRSQAMSYSLTRCTIKNYNSQPNVRSPHNVRSL